MLNFVRNGFQVKLYEYTNDCLYVCLGGAREYDNFHVFSVVIYQHCGMKPVSHKGSLQLAVKPGQQSRLRNLIIIFLVTLWLLHPEKGDVNQWSAANWFCKFSVLLSSYRKSKPGAFVGIKQLKRQLSQQ